MCSAFADSIDLNTFFGFSQMFTRANGSYGGVTTFGTERVLIPSCLYDFDTKKFFLSATQHTVNATSGGFINPTNVVIAGAASCF